MLTKIKEHIVFKKIVNSKAYLLLNKLYNYGNVKYVLFLYFVAFVLFFNTLLYNQFTIPLNGDFVLQEIPFYYNGYDDWWTYITTGEFVMWDPNTNLGANNIGSNSFYYLLNIFFLPTLLVPRALVPQMQAFLIITKMVLAGYVMKRLLDLFNVSKENSMMIGVAYAFCGWTLYYLWFNHFIEITILFPLVLIGLEKLFKDLKPTFLIVSLFLSAITNYFFFIMICFCSVIYAGFRYFQQFKQFDNKKRRDVIILGFTSYVVGLLLAAIVLLPCFAVALESSRAESSSYLEAIKNSFSAIIASFEVGSFELVLHNFKSLFENIFYFHEGWGTNTENISNLARVYLYPLLSFFYPTVTCSEHILVNNNGYDNALSSLFLYTPIMILLIPSIINSLKERKVSHIVGIVGMLILIFTPFAYYCFSGFTNICYGRWQLFPVVCMFIYVAISFEKKEKFKLWQLDVSLAFILAMDVFLLIMAKKLQGTNSVDLLDVDATNVVYAQMAYVIILYIYMRKKWMDKNLTNNLRWVIATEAFVSFNLLLGFTININNESLYVGLFGTSNYQDLYGGQDSRDAETSIIASLKKQDKDYYRIYNTNFTRSNNNLGMLEGYNGLGTFHSIYNYEIDDFANWTHFKYNGSWSMGEHEKKANMDSFLNVKYLLTSQNDTNIPFGYSEVSLDEKYSSSNKKLYINNDYIPLGFNFTNIISADYVNSTMQSTLYSGYYFNSSYTGLVPKTEYLLTSSAIMYEEDVEEIIGEYSDFTYNSSINYNNYFQGKIYTRPLSGDEIKVKRALWDDGPGGSGDFLYDYEESTYSLTKATGLKWNSQLEASFTDLTCIAPDASSRGGAYVTITARMGENLIISLYDKDDNLICSDNHAYHYFNPDKPYDTKYERGFYVDRPVYRIHVLVQDTFDPSAILCKPNVTYQYYDTYKQNIDYQKSLQFSDIEVGVNQYKFSSNHQEDMISVLTVPYDKGWKLYRYEADAKEEVKIYKGQGGFVSFVNEKGNCNYRLVYQTPYLAEGAIGFIAGSIACSLIYYSFDIMKEDKKYIKKLMSFTK